MKKILILALLLLSSVAHAGFKELTFHSRANCGNNESISWHFGHNYNFLTESAHYKNTGPTSPDGHENLKHVVSTGWENTWRSAAVHWGEATPGSGWWVVGRHYMRDTKGRPIEVAHKLVDNCAIYDGWWDK